MTLLNKARQNRLVALAVKAELARRKDDAAAQATMFRSRRTSDNMNWAPQPAQRTA